MLFNYSVTFWLFVSLTKQTTEPVSLPKI